MKARRTARASFAALGAASLLTAGWALAGVVDDAERLLSEGRVGAAREALAGARDGLNGEEAARALWLLASITDDAGEARELYVEISQRHDESPHAARALVRLGELALVLGDPAAAHAKLTEALDRPALGATEPLALLRDAQALLLLDQAGEARVRLRRLLDAHAKDPLAAHATLLLAAAAAREGDDNEALRLSLDVEERYDAFDPPALLLAARALIVNDERELALGYLDDLWKGHPDTGEGATARHLADSLRAFAGAREPTRRDTTDAGPSPTFSETKQRPLAPGRRGVGRGIQRPGVRPDSPLEVIAAYYVQLGAFRSRVGALRALSRLRRAGYENAEVHRGRSGDERLYRLRVGPYETREEAVAEQEDLQRSARVDDSFVVEEIEDAAGTHRSGGRAP